MELAALVRRYAGRFAAVGGSTHHVGSPLGAWLVLALAAPAADDSARVEIADALGTDVHTAHRLAGDLLAHPHPAVAAALAVWSRPELTGLAGWRDRLPAGVQTGAIPTQAAADAWAQQHSLGLIRQFPLGTADIMVLLASALATKVTWLRPFDVVPGEELGGEWGERLTRVLHSRSIAGHRAFIRSTDRAGDVAVHVGQSDDDVEVVSVIAEPGVPAADVLAAAHEIAGTTSGSAGPRSLFDLPLGDGPLWTITEAEQPERGERAQAILPAWHASSEHKLLDVPDLGLGVAAGALRRRAGIEGGPLDAKQVAVAKYDRRGFEAAALTVLALALSARIIPPGPFRTATLRFAHPYAVVAATRARSDSPWAGLPVFAAWVTDPDDADPDAAPSR